VSRFVRIDLIDPHPDADLFRDEENVERLREDIAERGIQVPLHVFPNGDRFTLLAGHDRLEAARRAGLSEVPADFRSMLSTEAARFDYFVKDNRLRKQFNQEQTRTLIAALLKRYADQSDREIARMVGCSPSTVAPIRTDMEERGELSRLDSRMGADGKVRPRTYAPREPKTPAGGLSSPPETPESSAPAGLSPFVASAAEALPEDERRRALALVDSPGIPEAYAAGMIRNLAEMDEAERAEVYALNDSEDPRDRSLAVSRAAKKPPMPDPLRLMLLRLAQLTGECIRASDRYPDIAGDLTEIRDRVLSLKDHVSDLQRTA
jgi:ParB/RepB/Spo0J family partition protein